MTTNLKLNTANWFKKQLLLLGLFILAMLPLVGHAQQYPVRIIPVITPPYSLKLADYAHAPESKLQLQVLMTDLQQPQHHTGIKFFLQAGLNAQPIAQSNEFVIGQRPFLLTPGANITLTSSQLKHLFDPQNINGLNPQQYASPLPEGLYQFCFQAYDFYTKNNLSEKACASVFLNQYDPPQLNIPQNAEKIQAINPYGNGSGILFQWMPRQVAPNTKYNFILKEIWDTNQSPISAFLASPVLWKEETLAPNLYYSIDKTQLIPGRRYAWQVQAFSSNPFDNFNYPSNNQIQSANYKNNGLSEIFFFDYVENCQTPTFLMAKNKGRGRVEIHWNFLGNPAGLYKIQYRKKGANTPWMHTEAYQNSALINGLDDLTEYEYRVGAVCGNVAISNSQFENNENAYAFSPVQFFTTDSQDVQNNNFQCGVMPAVDISNKEPLRQSLVANDIFTAGDFPVTIIEAQGSNGIFTGTGFIQVPYLADTKIKVAFQNITINSDKKLISGTVETEYDPNIYISNNNGSNTEGKSKGEGDDDKNNNEDNENDEVDNTDNSESRKGNDNNSNQGENDNTNNEINSNLDNANNDEDNNKQNGENTENNEGGSNNGKNSSNNYETESYTIKYRNKFYKDGATIKIPYKRESKGTFEIVGKDINDKTKINWTLPNQKQPDISNNIFGTNQLKDLNLDYPAQKIRIGATANELPKKPKVFIDILLNEKKFKIKDFSISENANRVAKNGETLYYINKKGIADIKKTDFNITVTSPESSNITQNEIKPENIIWKINNEIHSSSNGKLFIKDYPSEEKELTVAVTAGNPNKITKRANIKWQNQVDVNIDLFQKFNKVIVFLQEFNKYSRKFGKIIPCEANILNDFNALKGSQKATFNLGMYSEEDPNSRELFDISETTIQLKSADIAKLKCSKSIGWSSFSLGNIYLKSNLGSNIDFKYKLKTKNESKTTKSEPEISGGLSLTFSGGFEANPEFDKYVFLDVNLNISAGLKTVYPYNGNDSKIGSYFFLGNSYLTVEGYLDGWITGGRKSFGPFNYLLYETNWISEKKLIFDLKNKDIYLE